MKIYSIVVTYNGENWIKKCVSSLVNSTLDENHKIIIVDNGSKDNTLTVLKNHFIGIEIIEIGENLGFGQANNIGIKKALENNADYVFLLNQDAWVENVTIQALINKHKHNNNYGILSPLHMNGTGNLIDKNVCSSIIKNNNYRQFISNLYYGKTDIIYELDFINAAAWLISIECIKKVGLFSPVFFHYGEDLNYIHRIQYHNFKVGLYPKVLVFHDREFVFCNKTSIRKEILLKKARGYGLLSNINKSFILFLFVKELVLSFGTMTKNLFRGNFIYFLNLIKYIILLPLQLPKIIKERKSNKKIYIKN